MLQKLQMSSKAMIKPFLFLLIFMLAFPVRFRAAGSDTLRSYVINEIKAVDNLSGIELISRKDRLLALRPYLSKLNDDTLWIRTWNYLGNILLDLSNYDSVEYCIKQAQSHLHKDVDKRLFIESYSLRGRYFTDLQINDSAHYYFNISLDLSQQIDSKKFIAGIYNNLGVLYEGESKFQAAFDNYFRALKVFEELYDLDNQATTLNNLGLIMEKLNESEKGIEYMQKAIELNTQLGNNFNLAMNYGNLGILYDRSEKYDEALKAHHTSLEISIKENIIVGQTRAFHNIGLIFQLQKKYNDAESYLLQSLEMCKKYSLNYGEMLNAVSLGELYLNKNNLSLASGYLEKAIAMAKETGNLVSEVESYSLMSQVKEKQGNIAQALEFLKLYTERNDSVVSITNRNHILEVQEKYESEKKTIENNFLKQENENKTRAIKLHNMITLLYSVAFLMGIGFIVLLIRNRHKMKLYAIKLEKSNREKEIQNHQLKELNTTKDLLFSLIGHDLRSPFNTLLGYLQHFIEEADQMNSEERLNILKQLYIHSNNTYTLLENLLQWAMSQRGHIAYHPVLLDIHELVEEQLIFLNSRLAIKKIKVANLVPEQSLLQGDRDMLHTIFRNLINNSIKFTNPEGTIRISSVKNPAGIEVTVSDSGVGMTAETIAQLLGNEQIVSTRGTENERGSGLGLLIIKEFLKHHNGKLSIQSEIGKGSRFSVFLPTEKHS